MSRVVRSAWAGALGACLGVLILVTSYQTRSAVSLEMDQDAPTFTSGFHPVEIDGDRTFAWTSARAVVRLSDMDRRRPWSCAVRMRGARGPELPQPLVIWSVDGITRVEVTATNEFQDLVLSVPARPGRPGFTLTLASAPTFTPGPGDPRVLGVQVDRIACAPGEGWLWPPDRAVRSVAVGAGSLGAALVASGFGLAVALAIAVGVTAGHVFLLLVAGGSFGAYPALSANLLVAASVVILAIVHAPRLGRRAPLVGTARMAVVASATLGVTRLAALVHPAKDLVDAVFQAHRLDWVLSGRYFFTQPLPDGVQFPYAIGLFLVAAPWTAWATDHVMLLRVVVVTTDVAAGLALYPLIVRWWGERRAALAAVLLYHTVPLSFVVVGHANLTNAFAQAVALAAIAAAVSTSVGAWRSWAVLGLAALTALACLSHVTTLMLLAGTLGAIALTFTVLGGADGRRVAVNITVAACLAVVVAWGVYYRHFPEVYVRAFERVGATDARALPVPVAPRPNAPAVLVRQLTWSERATDAGRQTVDNLGWPIMLLAAAGTWRLVAAGSRDRLSLGLAAWLLAWAAFLLVGTLTRVETQYQRYAAEFVGRVNLAAYPAFVILAARGLGWAFSPGVSRGVTVAGCAAAAGAILIALRHWMGWL